LELLLLSNIGILNIAGSW